VRMLPRGWASAPVGEVVAEAQPGFPSGRHNSSGAGVPHLRPMNVSRDGLIDLSTLKFVERPDGQRITSGDVLFNNTNSPELVGKTAFFDRVGEWAYSNHMTRLRPSAAIDGRFLAIQLHWLWISGAYVAVINNHVNQASVSTKTLLSRVEVVVPPLAEQRRIVATIEEQLSRLDAAGQALLSIRRRLSAMRLAALVRAMQRQNWRRVPVRDIGNGSRNALAIGPFGSNLKVSDYTSEGVPLVFVRNIRAKRFGGESTRFVSPDKAHELRSHSVRAGDVLVTKMGDPPGETAVYPEDQPDGIITADCIKISLSGEFDSNFVALALEAPEARREVLGVTKGVAQKKVSLARFKQVTVPAPSLENQRQVVAELQRIFSALEAQEAMVDRAEKRAAALRRSILAGAFRGELVPQDPEDEPASVLIESVAAARVATPTPERTPKEKTTA
jgi:type I restriction enzyme, S subunit